MLTISTQWGNVEQCARESMAKVAREVKDLPNYASEGEVRESV